MPEVPLTWPALIERFKARNEEEQHSLAITVVERIKRRIPQCPVGRLLLGADSNLSRIAILVGPEPCHRVFAAQAEPYAAAIEDVKPGSQGEGVLIQLMLVSYGNLARCMGGTVAAFDEQAMVECLVRRKSELDEFDRHKLATMCLAVGLPGNVMPALQILPPPPFEAGKTFGSSIANYIAYLHSALEAGATLEDVMPAWKVVLELFPHLFAAKVIDWTTLLWLARVTLGNIGGHPDNEIVDKLRAMVLPHSEGGVAACE